MESKLNRMRELRGLASIELKKIVSGEAHDLKRCKELSKELGKVTREFKNEIKLNRMTA